MKYGRNTRAPLIALAVLCLGFAASSARAEPTNHVINVTGTAERLVRPDVAHLDITIDSRDAKLDVARRETGTKTVAVLRSLKEIGLADETIDSGALVVQPEFSWDAKTGVRRLQGYLVARTVRVRLLDLDKLGVILERVVKVGANQIAPPQFALQNESSLRRELLTDATRDAKRNAAAVAAGLDAELGAVLRVDAIEAETPAFAAPMLLRASGVAADEAGVAESYRPGDIRMRVTVKASFAIAP
jgi:uncharacterized protein YggE